MTEPAFPPGDPHFISPGARARLDTVTKMLLIMAVALLVMAAITGWLIARDRGLSAVTSCQVRYNTQFAAVQNVRGALSDADRSATAALIDEVFTVKPGETQVQRAARVQADYLAYRQAEQRITAARAAIPLPPAARC